MYEPIRTKSVVHRVGGPHRDHGDRHAGYPRSSRAEALDSQLAGHLAALLAVTDELGLGGAAAGIAAQVTRLRGGAEPARAPKAPAEELPALHRKAHELAGRALVVAASRADTTVAILAAQRMEAHAAALASSELAGAL